MSFAECSGPGRRRRAPLESTLIAPLKKLLAMHRAVAWAVRSNVARGFLIDHWTMNRIMAKVGGVAAFRKEFGRPRWLEFGAPGMSDFIGQLRQPVAWAGGGAVVAIETKREKYTPSDVAAEQREFLKRVNDAGGLGFVAADLQRIDDILAARKDPIDSGHGYWR